jgi:hypothetical protein
MKKKKIHSTLNEFIDDIDVICIKDRYCTQLNRQGVERIPPQLMMLIKEKQDIIKSQLCHHEICNFQVERKKK